MQSKMLPDIRIAIKEYLSVIDEASRNVEPRLWVMQCIVYHLDILL